MSNFQNNKRIARNTIMLYFRMIVVAIVSFYTTRITLQLLGVEDFGIRNVISGIIGFLGIITTAMINASQRFMAFDLGKKDYNQFNRTFSTLINMFSIISIIGVLFLEITGSILIKYYLVIPEGRMDAVWWIFHFSVIGFVVSTMVIPFTSAVITFEKMDIFAYVSLLDSFLKLAVVYLLYIIPFDKLITVVFLTTIAHAVSNSIYIIYSINKLQGCRYVKCWDKILLRKLYSFIGWNFFGSATSVFNVQGLSIVLNIFFGPIVNAAKAIADVVNSFVSQVVSNFFLAVSPQIVKTYANEEKDYTLRIVIYSSKFALFLIALIAIPLINNMETILNLWLGKEQVNASMVLFSQWTVILVIAQTFEYPITQVVRATGDIKEYQIVNGAMLLLFIPLCYVSFKLEQPAIVSMVVLTALTLVSLQYRIIKLSKLLDISFLGYYRKVMLPAIVTIVPSALISSYLTIADDAIHMQILSIFLSLIITLFFVISVGMNNVEKKMAISFFKRRHTDNNNIK